MATCGNPLRDPKSLYFTVPSGHLLGKFPLEEEAFQDCEMVAGNCPSNFIAERQCVQESGPMSWNIIWCVLEAFLGDIIIPETSEVNVSE